MADDKEIKFQSGQSADVVVRVGDTVRRSLSENSEQTHKVYKALEVADFDLSPRFLGIDDKSREIITFIDGKNITEPTIELSIEAIKALRKFHDILATTDLKEDQETLCHKDFAPWNVLQSDNHVVGIIDFDDAKPGKRISDLAYACWTFLSLGDSSVNKPDEEQFEALGKLVEAYGDIDTTDFVEELIVEQTRVLDFRKKRIDSADSDVEKVEREKVYKDILDQINWVKANTDYIKKSVKR